MIRVLHVIDSLDLGGAQTALLNLLKYSDAASFHHEVATMHGMGVFWDVFEALGVRVHSLSPGRWPPAYIPNALALIHRERFDIVHCHLFASNWIAKPIARIAGVRVIFAHDQCNDQFRSRNAGAILIDAITNRLSSRVLAVSRSIENFLLEAEVLDPSRVVYLPNGVDLAAFLPSNPHQRIEAKSRFGFAPDDFVIAGIGRLVAQKNFAALVFAAAALREELPDARFALFGSGPEERALRRLAEPLGDRFRFIGTVKDRPAVFSATDLFILPSLYEGLPMTLLEAMASSVPAIASAVDGTAEIAENGVTALLCEPGDASSLTEKIRLAAADDKLRSRLATNARRVVATRFDARSLAADLDALYIRAWEER